MGPKLAFRSTLLLACGVQMALSQLFPWQQIINSAIGLVDINLPSVGNIPAFEIGACGRPPTVPKFNVTAFLGNWYAQRQTASSFQVGACPRFVPSTNMNKLLVLYYIVQQILLHK